MPLDDTGFRERFEPLDKIDQVIDLLATEERWCQGALVTPDGRRCIMGAIQAVNGAAVLVRPVSFAIRRVTGRRFGWFGSYIIPRFNDDRGTTHPLVMKVLSRARENIIRGMSEDDRGTIWRRRLAGLYQRLPNS
jgi:hypothetical protein